MQLSKKALKNALSMHIESRVGSHNSYQTKFSWWRKAEWKQLQKSSTTGRFTPQGR